MKYIVSSTYVDSDCTLFVWANPSTGSQVVATSEPGEAKHLFGPEAFVTDDSAFEAGLIPYSRIGRFIPNSKPKNQKEFKSFAAQLVREQHG